MAKAPKENAVRRVSGPGQRIASMGNSGALAPWPMIDRFPIIIGTNITFSYAAGAMRLALNGWRTQFVDMLGEILDHEPHLASMIGKRVLGVAGGRCEIVGARPLDKSAADKAEEIRCFVEGQVFGLRHRTQSFASLLWGLFYGLAGAENDYRRTAGWEVNELRFIHSRRLSYPDFGHWDVHVWDQGSVTFDRPSLTTGPFGLRVADYPGKFVIYSPQVRAEYPTREGLGRMLVTYCLLKRLIMRVSGQDFERFVKPWVIAYLATSDTGKPRAANDEDKEAAQEVMSGIGVGSLAGATLPDSVKLELLRAATTLSQEKFLEYLDNSITKLAVGQTFTTSPGKFGSKGANQTGKQDALELNRYDAACFADTIRDDLIVPLVALNYPGCEALSPTMNLHVEEPADPLQVMTIAEKAAANDMPVDADELADQIGLKLVPKENESDVRRLKPIKMTEPEGEEPEDNENPEGDGGDEPDEADEDEPLSEAAE